MRPKLPLRVVRSINFRDGVTSVRVEDERGRSVFIYCDDDGSRRDLSRKWSSQEAIELAQLIARFLTDEDRIIAIEDAVRRFTQDDWFKPSGRDG